MKSVLPSSLFFWFALLCCGCSPHKDAPANETSERPNFLILMSDNHSWNHVGCYGNKEVKTPNIDQIAKEGIRFTNAFCTSPSCSPARAAMLTGQDIWQLEEAANLWGSFPKANVYPELMAQNGYHVGIEGKGWGPGNAEVSGWEHNPGGKHYNSFKEFYHEIEQGQPWAYWYSSRDPHRPYKTNGWKELAIDPSQIEVPPYLPDTEEVRKDIADYYGEIQNFDKDCASYLALVREMGELDNTIIVVCSDNGWQMPRGLANLYDFGTKIPLIISWPGHFKGNRAVDDFVSLNDFAPTFLELAGIAIPDEMTAKSIAGILRSDKNGKVEEERDQVVMARERHAFVRQGGLGYPGRALRTNDFLFIKNYEPERWPAGDPPLYGDVDAHMLHYPAPTKIHMLANKNEPQVAPLFDLAFGKRPAEELYDLSNDPYQMNNVADQPEYQEAKQKLSDQLIKYLIATGDPRETEADFNWDAAAYYKEIDKTPRPSEEAIEKLGLKDDYTYIE